MSEFHAGDSAGNADSQQAVVVRVVANVAIRVQVHGFGGCKRRFFPEIEGGRFAVRTVVDHEAAAADIAGCRPGDRHRECGRNRSINGITALFHDLDADF